MVDYGVLFGITGLVVALVSLAYSHAQAGSARRQADAETRLARIEISNAFADRVRHIRGRIITNASTIREYESVNPRLAAISAQTGGFDAVVVLRDFLDATQEMLMLRRDGLISDHEWRSWMTSAAPIARMPSLRVLFENGVEREAFDPAFVPFFRRLLDEGVADDPLGKVALPAPPTPAPP